ncbi:hypothetical protein EK21DRAFT_22916, partial [Setomelanomma holmii]
VEMVVGPASISTSSSNSIVTCLLPRALISHYSPKIRDECDRHSEDDQALRIVLSAVDPIIFELFVEWMYDGLYTSIGPNTASSILGVSLDAQAWVLWDTLQSTDFKNYAMDRIFYRYGTDFATLPITAAEVRYVCMHTAVGSRLRQIFFDLLAVHFSNTKRTEGSIAEWDEVMQEYSDLRMYLLMGIR